MQPFRRAQTALLSREKGTTVSAVPWTVMIGIGANDAGGSAGVGARRLAADGRDELRRLEREALGHHATVGVADHVEACGIDLIRRRSGRRPSQQHIGHEGPKKADVVHRLLVVAAAIARNRKTVAVGRICCSSILSIECTQLGERLIDVG